ncbi:MAG: hypothetical protein R2729_29130 [Bryobacteraceae bacterium]
MEHPRNSVSPQLAVLLLAAIAAAAVLAVWSFLRLIHGFEPPADIPAAALADRIDTVVEQLRSDPDTDARPNPIRAAQAASDLEARRAWMADDVWRLCQVRDAATPVLAGVASLPPSLASALEPAGRASAALDKACALRSQFAYETDFDSLRMSSHEFETRRDEAASALETTSARLRLATPRRGNSDPGKAHAIVGLFTALLSLVGLTLALLARMPTPNGAALRHDPHTTGTPTLRDFGNELTIIAGYTDLALDSLPTDHPNRSDLEQARESVHRAERTLRNLAREHELDESLERADRTV